MYDGYVVRGSLPEVFYCEGNFPLALNFFNAIFFDVDIGSQLALARNSRLADLNQDHPGQNERPENEQQIMVFFNQPGREFERLVIGAITLVTLIGVGAYVAFEFWKTR